MCRKIANCADGRTVSAYQNQQPDGGSNNPNFSIEGGEIRARGVELKQKRRCRRVLTWLVLIPIPIGIHYRYYLQRQYACTGAKTLASLWADYTFFDGPLSGLTLAPVVVILAPAMVIRLTPLKWKLYGRGCVSAL